MKTEKSTKEIAKEIKSEIQKIKGVKLSVKSEYNSIDVCVMQAPFAVLTSGLQYSQINPYRFNESDKLTKEGKTLFNLIDEIIKKYYWDESDPVTDYFFSAFYYYYSVGKWDTGFITY